MYYIASIINHSIRVIYVISKEVWRSIEEFDMSFDIIIIDGWNITIISKCNWSSKSDPSDWFGCNVDQTECWWNPDEASCR
jgi:hypothetical protein